MLLRARTVLPISAPPIEDGAVLLHGERILKVGRWEDLRCESGAEITDLGDTVLLPGLINAHCHLDYTDMAGLVKVPLLVFQGGADRSVPQSVNDRFVQGSGSGATYVVIPDAAHVASWNVAPREYDDHIAEFLESIEPKEG